MSTNDHVTSLIQDMYERSNLTDALTDDDAKILLDWGKSELTELATLVKDEGDLDSAARQARRVMRSINRLIEQKADLDDTKMVQRLLRLVEQSMQLAQQKSVAKSGV